MGAFEALREVCGAVETIEGPPISRGFPRGASPLITSTTSDHEHTPPPTNAAAWLRHQATAMQQRALESTASTTAKRSSPATLPSSMMPLMPLPKPDWSQVDWSLRYKEIAAIMGVSLSTVSRRNAKRIPLDVRIEAFILEKEWKLEVAKTHLSALRQTKATCCLSILSQAPSPAFSIPAYRRIL